MTTCKKEEEEKQLFEDILLNLVGCGEYSKFSEEQIVRRAATIHALAKLEEPYNLHTITKNDDRTVTLCNLNTEESFTVDMDDFERCLGATVLMYNGVICLGATDVANLKEKEGEE